MDVAVTGAVAAASQVAIQVAQEPGSRPAGAVGRLLGVAMALPLLARRRWPLGTLYAVGAVLFAYYSANFPGFAPTVVLVVPCYVAAEAGRTWSIAPVPVFYFTAATLIGLRDGRSTLEIVNQLLPHAALIAVALLLGWLVRSRRLLAAQSQERLRLVTEEHEREAAQQVAQERLRIARELHDTVSHALATVTVQSGAALQVLDERPDQAREALRAIRTTGSAALDEMRATLGVLRQGDEGSTLSDRAAGLDRLPALLAAVRAAGLAVAVRTEGAPVPLPSTVDHSGYRILQEALTNVLRHAGPDASATVHIGYASDAVTLEVVDDGAGCDPVTTGPASTGGHGVAGMRERAATLGGQLQAGPGPDGGYRVHAVLPLASGSG
jgi:signal transduction histidine kinase